MISHIYHLLCVCVCLFVLGPYYGLLASDLRMWH